MTTRVLLAEDNASLAQALEKFLTGQGLAVMTAPTGDEALRLLAGDDIDLLILDLRLPGVSGVEILQKIRKSPRLATLPVIVMSGVYKGDSYVEGAGRLGVKYYLEKPFSREAFLQAVQGALAEARTAVAPLPFLELLADIYNDKRTGTLALPQGSPVVFLGGEPLSFLSRGVDDFVSWLAGRGKIGLDDLRAVVASGEGRLFLTQAGLLPFEELLEESRLFLTRRLIEALETNVAATFREEATDPELPLVPLSVPRLLYEAVKGCAAHTGLDAFLAQNDSRYPARTQVYYRRANLTTLRQEDIELLERMNGARPLEEIATGPARQEAAAFFRYLLLLGMIEFHPAPSSEAAPDFPQKRLFNRPLEELPLGDDEKIDFDDVVEEVAETVELAVGDTGMAAPLSSVEIGFEQEVQRDHAFIKDKNYYELFGLTPSTFSFDTLKEAYFAKTRQYSPEKFMELSGTIMTLAQDVLAHYANAYNTLSSVVAKERYDEMLNADKVVGLSGKQDDRLQAKIQFQSGQVFIDMGEYDNAEKALLDAYTLEPDDPLHCAYLGWAIYCNPANRNSRTAQERARTLLGKSLQYGKHAEAFAFRGMMLLGEGRDGLAEGEFQKALRINPREATARKGLQQLTEKREAEKKGLFRKIFG
jgi:DNA-binding response OmpR family regulator/tetratricopeptide (TPR) repeat protein